MATLKDLLDSGMSRDEINALLSQSTVGTSGFQQDGYDYGPPVMQDTPPDDMLPPQSNAFPQRKYSEAELQAWKAGPVSQMFDRAMAEKNQQEQYRGESMAGMYPSPQSPPRQFLSDLAKPQQMPEGYGPAGMVEQAPLNTIRNNSTGVVTNMPSSGQRSHDVFADGAQVLHREQLADGTTRVTKRVPALDGFGRQSAKVVQEIEIPDYMNPAKIKELQYKKLQQELLPKVEKPTDPNWKEVESGGKLYLINSKTGEMKPAVIGGEQLKGKDVPLKAPTEDENKTAYHSSKMLDAINRIRQITKESTDAMSPGIGEAMAAATAGPYSGTANVARSGNRQAVFGLQADLVDSLLYLATGAAYNKEQLDQKRESLLPSFTDKPEAIAEKKRSLQEYMKAAKIRSGKAWKPEMESALNSIYADQTSKTTSKKQPPEKGTVKGGYVFIGGDPASESSWKKVQ